MMQGKTKLEIILDKNIGRIDVNILWEYTGGEKLEESTLGRIIHQHFPHAVSYELVDQMLHLTSLLYHENVRLKEELADKVLLEVSHGFRVD